MKNILLSIVFMLIGVGLFGQTKSREVSGIVKDTTDNSIPGATVTLTPVASKDSVRMSTNEDGIFVFRNVQSGQFVLTVKGIGYQTYTKKFLYNDATARIVLDPIILKFSSRNLNEVVINGTPAITYKTDTVEYRASDYPVKPNSSVEELIKKMEGVEVASDGSVTHQGIAVTKARVNGKDYFGGDVANAIQSLPADIVEKIQMVDDYGDQAARTGIKDGDPDRILNVVTRADRSVGNRLQLNGGAGNNDRYDGRLTANRFNANQQIAVQSNYTNTITGIAGGQNDNSGRGQGDGGGNRGDGRQGSSGSGGGGNSGGGSSGGVSESIRSGFHYSDNWNKKLKFTGSYSFNTRNTNSVNSSITQQFTQGFGTVFIANDGTSEAENNSHNFNSRIEYEIDSANYLQITPTFSVSSNGHTNASGIFQTGGIKQDRLNTSGTNSSAPNYGLIALYTHSFNKPRRNVSMQLSYTQTDNNTDRDTENSFKFYNPITGDFVKDSLVNLMINNGNISKNYRASMTYSEPLSEFSRLEFNGQVHQRVYDNSQVTSNFINGEFVRSDALSKIFNYSFTEQRYALNYRFQKGKVNVSLGMTAVPGLLSGTSETLHTTTERKSFNLVPITRFTYQWSRQKAFNLSYYGSPSEPSFNQIQDVPDVSNPQNPIIGNPDLKASFRHSIQSGFNNYNVNSRVNISFGVRALFTENKVVRNTLDIDRVLGRRETYYLNADGDYSVNGNYNLSKQLASRKYRFGINGGVNFLNGISMNNNLRNIAETWTFNQRLNVQIEPADWVEVTPNIRYTYQTTDFSLPVSMDSKTKNWALSLEGRFDFAKSFVFGYDASKNFVSGINANISNNPLIINSYISKDFFKRRAATLRFQAFDVLNQNNFIIRQIGDNSITDVKSNALSRYFMLSFTMRLQKWSGTPNRNGKPMIRRGDGSFFN